ncbi:MAG: 50S ribosomal protein L35 [Chloroflexi bacterium]|nr:50S ribosomal protein L35 [Chloroflexota bacterium]
MIHYHVCSKESIVAKKNKIKTHKATAKRFKLTGTGKIMRTRIGKSHLRRNKPQRLKNMFAKYVEVTNEGAKKRVRRLAPYLSKS